VLLLPWVKTIIYSNHLRCECINAKLLNTQVSSNFVCGSGVPSCCNFPRADSAVCNGDGTRIYLFTIHLVAYYGLDVREHFSLNFMPLLRFFIV